jgi:hypothetical protein
MRPAAEISVGLPVYVDLGAYVVVLPNAQIVVLDSSTLEKHDPTTFEEGRTWLLHALERGAERYPTLSGVEIDWAE